MGWFRELVSVVSQWQMEAAMTMSFTWRALTSTAAKVRNSLISSFTFMSVTQTANISVKLSLSVCYTQYQRVYASVLSSQTGFVVPVIYLVAWHLTMCCHLHMWLYVFSKANTLSVSYWLWYYDINQLYLKHIAPFSFSINCRGRLRHRFCFKKLLELVFPFVQYWKRLTSLWL